MATTPDQVTEVVTSEDYTKIQRARMDLINAYAVLHSGGVTESEKSVNAFAWSEKLLPYVLNGDPVTP